MRKGYALYAEAYCLMPTTSVKAAKILGIGEQEASRLYRRMRYLGLAHKSGRGQGRGRPIVYGAGGERKTGDLGSSALLINFAYVLKALEGRTIVEIGNEVGMCYPQVRTIVKTLHEHNRAHISAWKKQGNATVAEWSLGRKQDAPKPAKKPRVEQNRDAWQRRKQRLTQVAIQTALAGQGFARIPRKRTERELMAA